MLYTLFNVLYVLVAVAMVALILLQRGAGASAGSGFGAGASATVFGARGSANFLSKSTAILAAVFFVMALGMAIYLHKTVGSGAQGGDLGVMGNALPATSSIPAQDAVPAPAPSEVPAQPQVIPAVPSQGEAAPAAPVETPAPEAE